MTMAHNGLAKLAEELGELQQVVGKILAYGMNEHPDGKGALNKRFEEEAGDVLAAIRFVSLVHDEIDISTVMKRMDDKLALFMKWHEDKNA